MGRRADNTVQQDRAERQQDGVEHANMKMEGGEPREGGDGAAQRVSEGAVFFSFPYIIVIVVILMCLT